MRYVESLGFHDQAESNDRDINTVPASTYHHMPKVCSSTLRTRAVACLAVCAARRRRSATADRVTAAPMSTGTMIYPGTRSISPSQRRSRRSGFHHRHGAVLAAFAVEPMLRTSIQSEIGNHDVDRLRRERLFAECGKKTSITLPDRVKGIGSTDRALVPPVRATEPDQRPAVDVFHRDGEHPLRWSPRSILRTTKREKDHHRPNPGVPTADQVFRTFSRSSKNTNQRTSIKQTKQYPALAHLIGQTRTVAGTITITATVCQLRLTGASDTKKTPVSGLENRFCGCSSSAFFRGSGSRSEAIYRNLRMAG